MESQYRSNPSSRYNQKEPLPEHDTTLQLTLKGLGSTPFDPSPEMAPRCLQFININSWVLSRALP